MAENKVKFGLKNVHYAVRTNGTPGTPVAVPGAVSLSLDPQGEQSTFYADNIAYYVTQSNQGYSGDLELALIPDQMRQDLWGEVLQSTDKTLYELANTEPAVFDLGFQIEGDQQNRLIWLYGCTATRPAVGSTTIAESKEVQTETCTITASPLPNGLVKCVTTDETTETVRNGWFTAVYVPTI
jgi:phi13 family phage major tail protein